MIVKGRFQKIVKDSKGKNQKFNFARALLQVPGCYLIKNSSNEVVYVGYSSNNLYRTATRHFQSWDDPKQYRYTVNPETHTIRFVLTGTANRAGRLEKALILKHNPEGNVNLISEAEKRSAAFLNVLKMKAEYEKQQAETLEDEDWIAPF